MAKSAYKERAGVQVNMDAFKDNLRAFRKHVGMNDVDFAKELHVSPSAVRMWESGQALMAEERVKDLMRVAKENNIEVSTDFLFAGKGDEPEWKGENFRRHRPRALALQEEVKVESIPVKSAVDNGDDSITIGSDIERAPAPRSLAGRDGAYGLLIPSNAMAPALRFGDVAWIDPMLPVGPDMEVVVSGPDGTAAIGTLVSLTKDKVTIEILQPRRKIELSRAEAKIGRIVGKEARR